MRDVITYEIAIADEPVVVEMHPDPHLEEIAALVAVEEYGTKEFLAKYCPDGKLRLGVEGGPFDEHPDPNTGDERKKGCCLTLMAEALGLLEKAPWWRQMVAFCNLAETGKRLNPQRREATEARHPFDVYSYTRLLFRWRRFHGDNGGDPFSDEAQRKVIKHIMDVMRLFVWDQEVFHEAARLIKEEGRCEAMAGPDGKELKLVIVEVPGDQERNWHINSAARAWFKADVIVQKDPAGHVHIFTNNKSRLSLDDLAQAINIAEQEAEDQVRESSWETLREEGVPYEGGRWFYARPYGQLHNGTEHFQFAPTLLTMETIVDLVKMTLDASVLDAKMAQECPNGECLRSKCSAYRYGLQRCRQVRFKQHSE